MKNFLDREALESLLRRNWTSFISKRQLIAFVLMQVRDADLPMASGVTAPSNQGMNFTLSKVELVRDGLLLWIDFSIPTETEVRMGTCEAILSFDGAIRPINLLGQTTSRS